jgi:hypothetical protein
MEQSSNLLSKVEASLDIIVRQPNEVDFSAVVNFATKDETEPFVATCTVENRGRLVDVDKARRLALSEATRWKELPYSKYRKEEADTWLVAWLPIWDVEDVEQATEFSGYFIMYVSSTPQGIQTFNNAIMKHARDQLEALKAYLKAL